RLRGVLPPGCGWPLSRGASSGGRRILLWEIRRRAARQGGDRGKLGISGSASAREDMNAIRSYRGKLALFVALSVLDLVLTWYLLRGRPGRFYEGNPVAGWWLASFGWVGLAGFKVAVVLVALGAIAAVARARPRAAGWLLSFACLATAAVVTYSCCLLKTARSGPLLGDLGTLQAHARVLDRERLRGNEF